MSEQKKTFTDAVVACLLHNAPDELLMRRAALEKQVQRVLGEGGELLPEYPDRNRLQQALDTIRAVLSAEHDRIVLIAGGATKIKGYVFEAPKLPEIRGASALLDWVNEVGLNDLWYDRFSPIDADRTKLHPYIIYASGGGFLAFAPAELGDEMAAAIERCYTEHTLTANSVAVSQTFSLLELRYGRLRRKPHSESGMEEFYWVEDFIKDCEVSQRWTVLKEYYYPPEGVNPNDMSEAALRQRFSNRKKFGELVTELATMTNRRREERATYGDMRSVPIYPMLPWAEKCDSSGIRPVVFRDTVNDEQRQMSEASARKRYIGQLVKVLEMERETATAWFIKHFGEQWPATIVGLEERSWEQRWQQYLNDKGKQTCYARVIADLLEDVHLSDIRPAQDVGEISQASAAGRYIGLIYADGNNVGRLVATLATPQSYSQVSNCLRNAAKDAVFAALGKHLRPALVRPDHGFLRWVHPFEILAIGGDDLLLIVPGSEALDIASTIAFEFESRLARDLPERCGLPVPKDALSSAVFKGRYNADTRFASSPYTPLIGLSTGVVIAQENAPIFFLRTLVEELLKRAKKLASANASDKDKDDNLKPRYLGGAVDFMVMKSITMVTDNITAFRKVALGDQSKRRLTARPYTWHELVGLLETVRALKRVNFPRSQLHRLRRVMDDEGQHSTIASTMEYLYTRVRLRDVQSTLAEHVERNWYVLQPLSVERRMAIPPWLPLDKDSWETTWPDLVEAYDMITLPEREKR